MEVARIGPHYTYQSKKEQNTSESETGDFNQSITSAEERTREENDSKIIGLTMITEEGSAVTYGMKAQYAKESTTENPIIQITSNQGGERVSYYVRINEIDPRHASPMEMFAFCSYADEAGLTARPTYGSFQKLKVFAMNAEHNGYCESMSGTKSFISSKFDWVDIVGKVMSDYLKGGIYNQCKDGNNLLQLFQKSTK